MRKPALAAEAGESRADTAAAAADAGRAATRIRGPGADGVSVRAARRPGSLSRRLWRGLTAPRGNRMWDAVLRGTGVLGLVGLLAVGLFEHAGPLAGLAVYTVWVSGPLSPFFPVGLEPVLMLYGRLYRPLLVAGVATGAAIYVEFLNYHLYGKLLGLDGARRFRESRAVRLLQRLFRRSPFLTVWVCGSTPLPFWGARVLAALSEYPMGRYLTAAALGRLPKYWLFAALGLYWGLSDSLLLGIVAGSTILAVGPWIARRLRGRGRGAARGGGEEEGRRGPVRKRERRP